MSVKLGDKIKDRISGLTGICTGKADYLFGCKHVLLAPQESKDGKAVEASWVDEDRTETIEAAVFTCVRDLAGGPSVTPLPPA